MLSCLLQVDDEQAGAGSSSPAGSPPSENLLACFECGSNTDELTDWDDVKLHCICTVLEDDNKSLWDFDGRDQVTGLCRDAAGNWIIAALRKPRARDFEDGQPPSRNSEDLSPVPLESLDGTICGKLNTRVLLQACVDVSKIRNRASLERAVQLQHMACALQQSTVSPSPAQGTIKGQRAEESKRIVSLCINLRGFAFQERACYVVVPRPTKQNLPSKGGRSIFQFPLGHPASEGYVLLEEDFDHGEHGSVAHMQRVTAKWEDVHAHTAAGCNVGGKFSMFVGTGRISAQLKALTTNRCAGNVFGVYLNSDRQCYFAS
jgi:hypothetical protein